MFMRRMKSTWATAPWIDLTIGDQVVRYQFHSDSQVIVRKRIDLGEQSPIDSFGMTDAVNQSSTSRIDKSACD